MMTNKFHKINRNWQGQRLLPAAPLLGVIKIQSWLTIVSHLTRDDLKRIRSSLMSANKPATKP
jgi:hypothetical protein